MTRPRIVTNFVSTDLQQPKYLVSIVGSAGSLAPLVRLVRELTPDMDAAILVIIHRAARGRTYLAEILSRAGLLPVIVAEDGQVLTRGHIYIVPPGDRHALVQGHTIRLVCGPKVGFHRPAGDPLLDSAAAAFGRTAVAVILSGMGHNGAGGVAAIKRAGGTFFVQSLDEAQYPSMPDYALRAATPDLCAPAADIGRRLAEMCSADHGKLPSGKAAGQT